MNISISLAGAIVALAAGPAMAQEPFDCSSAFEDLKSTVETNYAGYVIEYAPAGPRRDAYLTLSDQITAGAAQTRRRMDCTRLLNRYVGFFSDPHLFLQDTPVYDEARQAAFRQAAPVSRLDVAALRAAALSAFDPVAGIWATEEGDVAVVPGEDGFDAVMIAPNDTRWQVGQVRARLKPVGPGYDVTLYRTADRAPILRVDARLEGDLRLRLAPSTWGRVSPAVRDLGDAFDPRAPRQPIYIDHSPQVGILYLPSFDPAKSREAGARIMQAHAADIAGKQLLVIDIRGNEGGSQSVWAALAPFYATGEWEAPDQMGPAGGDVVLAAPRVIEIWRSFRDNTGPGAYRSILDDLVSRLEAATPGALVPFRTDASSSEPETPEQLAGGPQAVAVLTDSMVVSAGEAFLLTARRSPKVTVFGHNSMGSIDYWTVGVVSLGEGEARYGLGLPIGAASASLPTGGYNTDGVPVDVPLTGAYETWLPQVLARYGLD